jgi:hypothetical protein
VKERVENTKRVAGTSAAGDADVHRDADRRPLLQVKKLSERILEDLDLVRGCLASPWVWLLVGFMVDLLLMLELIVLFGAFYPSVAVGIHFWLIIGLYSKGKHDEKVDRQRTGGWETKTETDKLIEDLKKTKKPRDCLAY